MEEEVEKVTVSKVALEGTSIALAGTAVGVGVGGGAGVGAGIGALLGFFGGPFAPLTCSLGAATGAAIGSAVGGLGGASTGIAIGVMKGNDKLKRDNIGFQTLENSNALNEEKVIDEVERLLNHHKEEIERKNAEIAERDDSLENVNEQRRELGDRLKEVAAELDQAKQALSGYKDVIVPDLERRLGGV